MASADAVPARDPVLCLAEVLDLRAAAPLAADLAASRGLEVELDASQVRRLGGQCLQILLSAQAFWEADDIRFRIVSPSAEFTDGLALLGAAALFPIPEA